MRGYIKGSAVLESKGGQHDGDHDDEHDVDHDDQHDGDHDDEDDDDKSSKNMRLLRYIFVKGQIP